MDKQPNILFVLVDALRAGNLNCYGYSKPTSPNIDNLAKGGILFENAFCCTITTYPSLTTIFSGDYPVSHGVIKIEPTILSRQNIEALYERGTVFLPEILKTEGYTTLAVDWLGRWLKRGYDYYSGITLPKGLKLYGFVRKFLVESIRTKYFQKTLKTIERQSHYRDLLTKFALGAKLTSKAKSMPVRHAEAMTQKAINLIEKFHNRKFFLFVHYWDTHTPYNPPVQYVEKFAGYNYGKSQSIEELLESLTPEGSWYTQKRILHGVKGVKEILARYDSAIAYVDNEIGRLIKTLENYGILDETLIILTSDHGESLTEHGIYFAHHGLYDVTTHVPLILRHPSLPKNKSIKGLIQHTEITPTILDLLKIKNISFESDGKSAVPLIYNEVEELRDAVLIEEGDTQRKMAIRTDKHKYISALSKEDATCRECGYIHGGIEEFYDLNKDPEENSNALEEDPRQAKLLREELWNWVEILKSKRKKGVPKLKKAEMTYSTEEEKIIAKRLRELGYY